MLSRHLHVQLLAVEEVGVQAIPQVSAPPGYQYVLPGILWQGRHALEFIVQGTCRRVVLIVTHQLLLVLEGRLEEAMQGEKEEVG
mmetsp:Transcript_37185/g.51608  ORF Transcript_37185/g.51608 Transcript_37185/m.51608 type:complete len:85 (-) Transcript_37185:37-291(-)